MKKEIIQTPKVPKPVGPYSQAVCAGSLVFCSGQISIDPETDEIFKGDIKVQAEMVMSNIKNLLAAAQLTFDNVVKTTIFLTDMNDFAQVNEVYARSFKEAFPARSTVAVAGLPKGVKVEIEVIASA